METQKNGWSNWRTIIRRYTQPNTAKSWWQVINSFIPYIALWILMIYSLNYSYWYTLALSFIAAGFLVRIFIIFHDCGHGSFFKSTNLNKVVGIIAGGLTFTPYHKWHYQHMVHHQTVGNLDKRGMGDVMTLTLEEFKNSPKKEQNFYRWYRNPVILLIIVPFFLFTVINRFPDKKIPKQINMYTHLTSIALIVAVTILSLLIGFKTFALIQVPVLVFASIFGVWLFYIQHQFKDVIWERNENWDYTKIAMMGCSFVKFPRILQWFSGNIGFHHIHHLSLKIPNYNLEKCHRDNPIFQKEPLTFLSSLQCVKYRLWDEDRHKLVSFKEAMV
ncbi:MAG: fatty acid desaturase [Bacteroidales bacterium]|nr:fatty acid desaturase [Bacteroidales bacterium]MCF8390747.1 fatty acid desaturase [Bacteroidales bacterium]